MFSKNNNFIVLTVLLFPAIVFAGESTVKFWPRNNCVYLCQNHSMPVWPQIPEDALEKYDELVLTFVMPGGFSVTGFGSSTSFAIHPKPLIIPKSFDNKNEGENSVSRILIPSLPADETEDSLKYPENVKHSVRASILITPGQSEPDEYPVTLRLTTVTGEKVCDDFEGRFIVLPELKGKRPSRIRIEVFDYAGYTNPVFKEAMIEAVLNSGINTITNMRLYEQQDTLAQILRDKGCKPCLILFWHNLIPELARKYPEACPMDNDGNRITQPSFVLKNNICHTWCLQNKEKVREVLKDYFRKNIIGKYASVTNDNEEQAIARDKSYLCGDIYTPITIKAFTEFASIEHENALTCEIILKKYQDKWVDFRCWQSAQMSFLLSETLSELDPSIEYGYYSGNKYVGKLAGFTRNMYATDWDLLAEQGGIQFGSSGYYGSTADYTATTEALGDIPHIPAEMYIENFLDFNSQMPDPDHFTYRLMNSLMYGSGGVAVWYLQVLDAAGFHAISEISAIAAEIEDYLLDGQKCNESLVLPATIDPKAVFAYQLGEKRMVAIINHSTKTKTIRYGWKKPIKKPDTIEIVSGRHFADAALIDITLKPKKFAVFITLSQGN